MRKEYDVKALNPRKNPYADKTKTKQLQEEIDMIKKNPNISLEYMSINARETDLREEGRAEGREEGHKEGVFDTIVVFNMIKDNQISMQEGAKRLNISEAELKKML